MKCERCGGKDAVKCIFKDYREHNIPDNMMNVCLDCIKLVNRSGRGLQVYKDTVVKPEIEK